MTGLRIEGPDDPENAPDETRKRKGIVTSHDGLEVDNCELYAWPHIAVFIETPAIGTASAYIHHNFIHDNLRPGYGYGVHHGDRQSGYVGFAESIIEANIFDDNRHSIALGYEGNSYEARYNLVLELEDKNTMFMPVVAKCGEDDYGNCTEPAGTTISVHHNTFYTGKYEHIRINAIPVDRAEINNNLFELQGNGYSVINQPNDRGHLLVHHNAYFDSRYQCIYESFPTDTDW